jgi:hypothetical protein
MISEQLIYSTIDELKLIYEHAKRILGEHVLKEKLKDFHEEINVAFYFFDYDPIKFLHHEEIKKDLEVMTPSNKLAFLALTYEACIQLKSKQNGNS